MAGRRANELTRLKAEGATIEAAYTDNEDKAFAFKTAVPSQAVYTLGTGAAATGTTPIPGDDMVTHASTVAGQPALCRAGWRGRYSSCAGPDGSCTGVVPPLRHQLGRRRGAHACLHD